MNDSLRRKIWLARGLALGLAVLSGGGCQIYHNLGSGPHYDAPSDEPKSNKGKRVRDITLEVTTDATGAVTQVQFKRSSGSPDLDSYIADSVRTGWKGGPSARTVVELTYSGEKGFSQPRMISTKPVP